MTKRISRIIAIVMFAIAVTFVYYALTHPEAFFSWSNTITYIIYTVYVIVMIMLFIAPFKNKE